MTGCARVLRLFLGLTPMETWTTPSKRPRGQEAKSEASGSRPSGSSSLFDERQISVMAAKLALQTAAIVRDHSSALSHTALLPMDSPVTQSMLEAGRRYAADHTNSNKKVVMEGSPHQHIWCSLVLALQKLPNLPEDVAAPLRKHAAEISNPTLLQDDIHVCRTFHAHDGRCRIVLSLASRCDNLLVATLRGLQFAGALIMHGAPPRSTLERQLASLLSASIRPSEV